MPRQSTARLPFLYPGFLGLRLHQCGCILNQDRFHTGQKPVGLAGFDPFEGLCLVDWGSARDRFRNGFQWVRLVGLRQVSGRILWDLSVDGFGEDRAEWLIGLKLPGDHNPSRLRSGCSLRVEPV